MIRPVGYESRRMAVCGLEKPRLEDMSAEHRAMRYAGVTHERLGEYGDPDRLSA